VPVFAAPLLGALGGIGLFSAANVSAEASLNASVAAGLSPPQPGAESEDSVEIEAIPGLTLRLETPRAVTTFAFEPRFFYRWPNASDLERPLMLMQGRVGHEYQLSHRSRYITNVGASYGETDYASSELAFGGAAPRALSAPVIRMFNVTGSSGVRTQLSETHLLGVSALAGHTRPLGTEAQELFTTTMVGALFEQAWQLDPRTTLSFPVTPQYFFIEPGPNWWSVSGQLAYQRQLNRRTRFTASAGATAAGAEDQPVAPFPAGMLEIVRELHARPGARLTNGLTLSLAAFYDPTVGDLTPVAAIDSNLHAELGTDWTLSLAAGASAALTEPDEPVEGVVVADATYLHASAEVGYRISNYTTLSGGVRVAARTGWPLESSTELVDEEVLGFIAIRTSLLLTGSRGQQ
jgi:hypothetical protein